MPATKPPFRFWRFFFSPQGRASRMAIWTFALPVRLTLLAIGFIMQAIGFPIDSVSTLSSTLWFTLSMTSAFIGLITMWPMFAVLAKRCHDIGWTALPALIVFMPLVSAVFTFMYLRITQEIPPNHLLEEVLAVLNHLPSVLIIVLAFIPGQKTTNRFGPPVTGPADDEAKHF